MYKRQGLLRGGLPEEQLAAQGYGAMYAVAADQLGVGVPVVADMVNPIPEVREAWDAVAAGCGARILRVLVECSDPEVHRARVERRTADIEGHRLPTWGEVRGMQLQAWPEADLRVDSAILSVEEAVELIVGALEDGA